MTVFRQLGFNSLRLLSPRSHTRSKMEIITGGVEAMAGNACDPLFDPVIAFGLGGIHVEIHVDLQVRVALLTDRDASDMVRAIKGYRLGQDARL